MIDKNLIIPNSIEQVIGLIERDMLGKFEEIKFFNWQIYNEDNIIAYFVASLEGTCGFDKDFIDDIMNDCSLRNVELVDWAIFDPDTLIKEIRIIEFNEHDLVIMLQFRELK